MAARRPTDRPDRPLASLLLTTPSVCGPTCDLAAQPPTPLDCGAFGGNRVVMAVLQILAAGLAGVDQLVFHDGGHGGRAPLEEAPRWIDSGIGIGQARSTCELIDRIEAIGFEWGVSDGN
jgi:hypothetical protein